MTALSRRLLVSKLMNFLAGSAAVIVILPLILIFGFLLLQGGTALNLEFFTHMPKPVGEPGGGMANAIVGTLILIALSCCVGLPIGWFNPSR